MDVPRSVHLLVAHLEVDECLPGLLVRFPLHPPFEHLAGAGNVADQLLHVGVFEPELGGPGQNGHCTVPDVPGMVHLLVPESEVRD